MSMGQVNNFSNISSLNINSVNNNRSNNTPFNVGNNSIFNIANTQNTNKITNASKENNVIAQNKGAAENVRGSYDSILQTLRSQNRNFSQGGRISAWLGNFLSTLGISPTKCAEQAEAAARMMRDQTGYQTGLVVRQDYSHMYNYVDTPQGRMYFDVWKNRPPSFDRNQVDSAPIGNHTPYSL